MLIGKSLGRDGLHRSPQPAKRRALRRRRRKQTRWQVESLESRILLAADLSIAKMNGVDAVAPGDTVTYTIVVTNDGPDNAGRINVVDQMPAALSDVSYTSAAVGNVIGNTAGGIGSIDDMISMESGVSLTYTVVGTLEASSDADFLNNTATVSVPEIDPDESDNSATDSDPVVPLADLSVTKTNGLSAVEPGQSVDYTIVVMNNGPSDARRHKSGMLSLGILRASLGCVTTVDNLLMAAVELMTLSTCPRELR